MTRLVEADTVCFSSCQRPAATVLNGPRVLRAITLAIPALAIACSASAQRPPYLQPRDDLYVAFFNDVAQDLVPDRRLPREADFVDYWKAFESFVYRTTDDEGQLKAPFWTKGLFNDDEVIDWAFYLMDVPGESKWLYALLSERNGYRAVLLDGPLGTGSSSDEMAVRTQRPGTFSAVPDGTSEPIELRLIRDGIVFFPFESHGSVFVWSAETETFARYWGS